MRSLILLLLFFCSLPIGSAGTTYYAAPNGSSGNTGLSTSSPWPLAYAVANAGAGNTVIVMPGNYSAFKVAQPYLTVKSQVKWGAVVANAAGLGISTADGTDHVTIDGFCVTNATVDGIKVNGNFNVVRNCWVTHCGDQGIASHTSAGLPANDCIFENNLSEYNGDARGTAPDHDHGFYIGGERCLIRNNVARHNAGYGIQVYPEDGFQCAENQIYNNLVYSNDYADIYGGGITVYTDTSSNVIRTNHVFGNTVIEPIASEGCIKLKYGYANVTNNILLGAIRIQSQGGVVVRADYNLSTASISPAGSHNIVTGYIGFVNTQNGLYWLKSDSPARGKALPTACGPVDFFGNAQSLVTDLGAFQYNAAYASDTRVLDPSPANPDYWAVLTGTNGGSAAITITPASQGFGTIPVGTTTNRTFTVQNSGSGTLSGSASVTAPFSIISGGSYNLGAGLSQVVTVRYSPTTAGSNAANVTFTGANSATAGVSGSALSRPPPPENLQIVSVQ